MKKLILLTLMLLITSCILTREGRSIQKQPETFPTITGYKSLILTNTPADIYEKFDIVDATGFMIVCIPAYVLSALDFPISILYDCIMYPLDKKKMNNYKTNEDLTNESTEFVPNR